MICPFREDIVNQSTDRISVLRTREYVVEPQTLTFIEIRSPASTRRRNSTSMVEGAGFVSYLVGDDIVPDGLTGICFRVLR